MPEDLKTENARLREMVALKSDLISISAHELRTSLTALKWILKMFLDRDLGSITAEQENLMQKAYNNNERLIGLVNDMLSQNRAEDASISYKFEETDIVKLIEEIVFEFIGESYKLGIEVIFLRPEEDIPPLKIDPGKIRVVFQNLIENAIKYSDKGGRVFISLKKRPDEIEFSVKDTGIGIKEEDKEKIFGKFFRGTNARQKQTSGTGLGLSSTKAIIERHGGKIWFESREKEGSTFYFTLPLS